jgi:hypothetical protein
MTESSASNPRAKTNAVGSPFWKVLDRTPEIAQVLVPGLFAWSVTVVPAAMHPSSWWLSKVSCFLGLGALVAGAFVGRHHAKIAYALGIWTFLGFSLLTWVTSSGALQLNRLDTARAIAGTFGWMLFALGWGTPWRAGIHPEDNPRARIHPKLEPRLNPVQRRPAVVFVSAVGAIACMLLAYRSVEPSRALMMHGVALACAVALISAGARVALGQGQKKQQETPHARSAHAFPWLMALIALAVIALAWRMAR